MNNPITSKDIIGWIVSAAIGFVPSLIFYLDSKKEIKEMLYKEKFEKEREKNKELKRRNEELEKENKELKAKKD